MRVEESIIRLLSFLGATKNYSYIDRVANSIDAITLLDALKDALRAYQSYCVDKRGECIEYEEKVGVMCPDIDPVSIDNAISRIIEEVSKSKIELLSLSRKLALKAYAEIPMVRTKFACTPGE